MKVRFSILQSLHAIVSLPNVTDNGEAVEIGSATTQAISYIPYGEVFVEQQAGGWSSPYLFNAKELDSETGLYYYGARYLDPSDAMWLSVDPLWEKYVGASPYNYCHGNPIVISDPNGEDEFVNKNGKHLGSSESGSSIYIVRNKSDRKLIQANTKNNQPTELTSLQETPEKLPIDMQTMKAAYNVLQRTLDNGGASEEISLVGKDGTEYKGTSGEPANSNSDGYVTATAPSDGVPSDSEIAASIHSHPFVSFSFKDSNNKLKFRCWGADDPSELDVAFFSRFDVNIIVGKDGKNLTPEYNVNSTDKNPIKYNDNRSLGIYIYGRNIQARTKGSAKWYSKSFIENVLKIK